MKNLNVTHLKESINNFKTANKDDSGTVLQFRYLDINRDYSYTVTFNKCDKKENDNIGLTFKNEDKTESKNYKLNDLKNVITDINKFLEYETLQIN